MNKEQALNEIKTRLKALFTSEVESTEVKLYQCTTMDGQVLETDGTTLEVGAAIYMIDGEGNRTPAEDGVYATDEYSIEVKDGAVAGIMETEVEVEVENPAEPVEATEKVETEMEVDETKDETKMSELESKVLEMSNMITSLIDITEKLNEKIVNLSNQPAVVPVIMEKNLTPAELRVERLKSLTKNK